MVIVAVIQMNKCAYSDVLYIPYYYEMCVSIYTTKEFLITTYIITHHALISTYKISEADKSLYAFVSVPGIKIEN